MRMLEKRLVRRSSATPPRGFPALPLSRRPPRARDEYYSDGLLADDLEAHAHVGQEAQALRGVNLFPR
jgi:hypothetical protein